MSDQLSFFDIAVNQTPIKKKVVTKPKRESKFYDFNNSCKKIKALLPSLNSSTRKNSIELVHEFGRLLLEMRIYKPTIEKPQVDNVLFMTKVSFWEYVESLFKLDSLMVFEYIRAYEIRYLLQQQKFDKLPDCLSHIKELWEYTDNQIIEIWQAISPSIKITSSVIKSTKDKVWKTNRYLESIESSSSYISYNKYLSRYYSRESININIEYQRSILNNNKRVNTPEYESLKEKYNSLVKDYNSIKSSDYQSLKNENQNLKSQLRSNDLLINAQTNLINELKFNELMNNSRTKVLSKSDCLELLAIKNNNPTDKEIKKAFKEQAFLLHPDHNSNLNINQVKIFEKEFSKVKKAYDHLLKTV